MRKSGKELRKEYQSLLDNTKALESRIVDRAEALATQYPDVIYSNDGFKDKDHMTIGDYKQYYLITPMAALTIIEKIEDHIAKQHPHQQKKMFE